MRADDLILFSQVIELGSFSKVAEANNLTNSVVSKRMARLEEEIGAQLLYRTTRKLTLTEAGKVLLHSAKNVKQATQEAMDAVAGFGENVSGHIKMSVPCISGDLILADAVAEFCNLHPGLTVDMSLDNRFVDLVADGYDLVIRTGYLADSSLIARHILDSQWVVCASPSYIAKNGKPIEPIDLTTHNCLQYAYQTTGATDWSLKEKMAITSSKYRAAFLLITRPHYVKPLWAAMVLLTSRAAWCITIFVMVNWWIFFLN